jgi:hypothetical protein
MLLSRIFHMPVPGEQIPIEKGAGRIKPLSQNWERGWGEGISCAL